MDKILWAKPKGPGASNSHSSGHKTSLENFLLGMYYLTKFDDVI